jgi:DNA invertase Pin-like site-specific DNA recombinase
MTANESLVGGLHVDLRMATGCGWPRPVVDQAIGLAVQERDLEVAREKMFSKQVSSVAKRDCHNEWLAHLRGGDVLMVAKPDRRARSTAELLEMEADLSKRDVRTDHSLHGRPAAGYPHQTGKLMLPILAGVATWEREIMLEHQRAGIAKAKAERRYKGRPAHIDAAEVKRLSADLGPAAIAKQLGVARSTVYRLLGQASPLG